MPCTLWNNTTIITNGRIKMNTLYLFSVFIIDNLHNLTAQEKNIHVLHRRGASERNFDCQNNDFGWAHMPFSFLKENTVFSLSPPPSSRTSTFTFLTSSADESKDLTGLRGSSGSCACLLSCPQSG